MSEQEELDVFYSQLSFGGKLGKRALCHIRALNGELAALREELDTAKRSEHNSEVAYRATIEKQEELRDRKNSIVDLQQRLTVAEHRNAELEKLLRQSHGVFVAIKDGLGLMDGFAVSTTIGQIETAIKPTESGASDAPVTRDYPHGESFYRNKDAD